MNAVFTRLRSMSICLAVRCWHGIGDGLVRPAGCGLSLIKTLPPRWARSPRWRGANDDAAMGTGRNDAGNTVFRTGYCVGFAGCGGPIHTGIMQYGRPSLSVPLDFLQVARAGTGSL